MSVHSQSMNNPNTNKPTHYFTTPEQLPKLSRMAQRKMGWRLRIGWLLRRLAAWVEGPIMKSLKQDMERQFYGNGKGY